MHRFKVGDKVRVVREGAQCIYPGYTVGEIVRVLDDDWYDILLLNFACTFYQDYQLERVSDA